MWRQYMVHFKFAQRLVFLAEEAHISNPCTQMIPLYLKLDNQRRSSRANFKVKDVELLGAETQL